MQTVHLKDIEQYVEENISAFHGKRIDKLKNLKLTTILRSKNPYLFKAKHLLTSEQIIKGITDAYLSSHEETIFADWLEEFAIFINSKVYAGWKSGISGIDVEFNHGEIRYIVAIKSGPNWGNSSQIAKMKSDFITAKRTLRTSNSKINIIAVNGCCYGRDNNPHKEGDYYKYCGQSFWSFISGDQEFYKKIINPLGYKAKEKNEEFLEHYATMINMFTKQFSQDFCKDDGKINWEKLVDFNSSMKLVR